MATLPAKSQLTGNVSEGQFKSGMNQLIDYISENVGNTGSTGKQVITTTSAWTVPDGVTTVYVSMCGGGGGGSVIDGCGGGGGASIYRKPVTVTPGESIACTIGAGGLGNQSAATSDTSWVSKGNVSGNDGGTTSFGSYLTAKGGERGYAQFNAVGDNEAHGGEAGGIGGTRGDMFSVIIATDVSSNSALKGGNGGSSLFGVGGTGGYYTYFVQSYKPGDDGIGFGAGGGGGGLKMNGELGKWTPAGGGTNGVIILEW